MSVIRAFVVLLMMAGPAFAQQSPFTPNSGDCNGNGTADKNEPAWASRDDDGDSVCNGADICPLEESNVCSMSAITVPPHGNDPTAAHPTYSGAATTLKGIARYGGNQYMWSFGDGSPSTAWLAMTNAYNLGVSHTYTGFVGQTFTATLSVRNSAVPSIVTTASYPIVIKDGGASLVTLTREQTDVRAQMALDEALWYLHTTVTRSSFADGAPGYRQNYAIAQVSSGIVSVSDTCLIVDAFAADGHLANGDYRTDPYVENVRRGLNYMLANSATEAISVQPRGNPDVNGNGLGVKMPNTAVNYDDETFMTGVCAMAFADSADPGWSAQTGTTGIYGRPHRDLAQDMVDRIAFAQSEQGAAGGRGGWGPAANNIPSNEDTRWAVMGLISQARMSATIPPFVQNELSLWLLASQTSAPTPLNGSVGFQFAGDAFSNIAFTGGTLLGYFFASAPVSYPPIQRAIGYIARVWSENDALWHSNLGDPNAMYSVARAMRAARPPITTIADYDYVNGVPGAAPEFHWYYGSPNTPQQGYAENILSRRNSNGSFNLITTGQPGNPIGSSGQTAMAAMTLTRSGLPATATVSASSIDFGTVDLNASAERTITLTNLGDYDLDIDSITVTGPFTVTSSDCGNLLAPAGVGVPNSCPIYVTFTTTTGGVANGTLTIAGAPGNPTVTIPLTGVVHVSKVTPVITWASPAPITYGSVLGSQLNATTDVDGTFVYSPAAGTMLNAGTSQLLSVAFAPKDTTTYNPATATVFIDVAPATPVLTLTGGVFPYDGSAHTASAQATGVFGETLGPVTITYNGQLDPPINAGTYNVVATIAASGNYGGASMTSTVVIEALTPHLVWTPPAAITYGATLGDAQLNAAANVAGTFAYTPPAGTALNAGAGQTLTVTFTPDSSNYASATATTTITVTKAIAVVAWATPAAVPAGTTLSAAQLNATANVPGTFAYSPAAGTVLTAGQQTLSVVFTPNDALNYEGATASVSIEVTPVAAATGSASGGGGIDASAADVRFEFEIGQDIVISSLRFRTYANSAGHRGRDHDSDASAGWDRFVSTAVVFRFEEVAGVAPRKNRPSGSAAVVISGAGTWNNQAGYTFEARATDAGEPGKDRDRFTITVTSPDGTVVASVDGVLSKGNIQVRP